MQITGKIVIAPDIVSMSRSNSRAVCINRGLSKCERLKKG